MPQVPDLTPVRPGPGRIATMWRKGSASIKDRARAPMPLGLSVCLAASSRPDAGLRLSDGRPTPPLGENGGQTGRPSPATTRQKPEADRESTPRPAGSHPGFRLAIDDPSSPAAPGSSAASSAKGRGRWLDAPDPNRLATWPRRQPAGAGVAVVSGSARSSSSMGLSSTSGPEPLEDLLGQFEENRRIPRVGRPLGAAGRRGLSVTRTPLTPRSITFGRSPR